MKKLNIPANFSELSKEFDQNTSIIMQICSKTQEFTQNSREIGQKTQFSGKSATLCLPEDRPLKRPELVEIFVFVFSTNQTKLK